jgi:hypothetical protein
MALAHSIMLFNTFTVSKETVKVLISQSKYALLDVIIFKAVILAWMPESSAKDAHAVRLCCSSSKRSDFEKAMVSPLSIYSSFFSAVLSILTWAGCRGWCWQAGVLLVLG